MPVHISIHDVRPGYEVELEQILLLCRARGVRPALLVTPKPSGGPPLAEGPFARRLRELSAGGSEILLHDAANRLDTGLRTLEGLGLTAQGFVPVGWALPRSLLPRLAVRKIRYTEDRFGMFDPVGGRYRSCCVLTYATESRLSLALSLAVARAARGLRHRVPLRLAVHPSDLRCPPALRELVRALDWARGDLVGRVDALFEAT